MTGIGKLFYCTDQDSPTLHNRISLSDDQKAEAKSRKDQLLDFLKGELAGKLGVPVKHWLQGSYKNHTVIRPVTKGGEFDVDVGIYLLCNANRAGIQASDVRIAVRDVLTRYANEVPDAKLHDGKSKCERVVYEGFFHLDIPTYYFDEESGVCRLAAREGWIDSDPKALQDWFDSSVKDLTADELAQLRRTIRYLKAWSALKFRGETPGRIPSVALTVLAVNCFTSSDSEDEALTTMVDSIAAFLEVNSTLASPVDGSDLLEFDIDAIAACRDRLGTLNDICQRSRRAEHLQDQFVLWSSAFEHMFPPLLEHESAESGPTNLPAITTPPRIRVRHLDSRGNVFSDGIAQDVRAYKRERLYFSIANAADYSANSTVHWVVRNQGDDAASVYDLGHSRTLEITEVADENCEYNGTHYMECLVVDSGVPKGLAAVRVTVIGLKRPERNPPRVSRFKGL